MEISKEILIEIAGQMHHGMEYYIHRKTGELVFYPEDHGYLEDEENPWQPDILKVSSDFENYIEIVPMPSAKGFSVMEDFAYTVKDKEIQNILLNALSRKKPFAHFNAIVHQLPENHRNAWFAFKEEKMVEHIKEQLEEY
jgi:phage pi2 protein 07